MISTLKEFKPANVTAERGLDNAMKIIDEFIEKENEREGIFTYEIEINDLLKPGGIHGSLQLHVFQVAKGSFLLH